MKKLMSFIIAAAMLFAMIPALGEEPAAAFDIKVPEAAVSGTAEACECEIVFDGADAVVKGDSASVKDGVLTITKNGSYLLSGNYTGSIVIDVSKEKKVELCLNGLYMTGMINVVSAPKNVTVTACAGSVNVIYDTSAAGETESAAIYSKEDLKFGGTGELYIVSENGRGVHSSDDIVIDEISLYVISAGNGIHGKDSVQIKGGSTYIKSGNDGIKATNAEDETKGVVEISGGSIAISAEGDGIQAATSVSITGGDIIIIAGDGYTASTKVREGDFGGGRGGMMGGWGGKGGKAGWGGSMYSSAQTASGDDADSQKGVKALNVTVSGGSLSINSTDDALHANKNLTVSAGTLLIYTGDDGLHADSVLGISGGSINVMNSYEGLEATLINISGGEIRITSTDDGINAGGDDTTVTAQASGGRMGGNGIGELNISGGYIVVNAEGDGMDTNNTGSMTGGILIVYGPTASNNGALDYENSFSYKGGTIIALGAAGMAQSVTAEGEGAVIAFRLSVQADTLLTITDADGAEVLAVSAPKVYSSLVFASDTLVSGAGYDVYTGGSNSGICTDYMYSLDKTTGATKQGTITAK